MDTIKSSAMLSEKEQIASSNYTQIIEVHPKNNNVRLPKFSIKGSANVTPIILYILAMNY